MSDLKTPQSKKTEKPAATEPKTPQASPLKQSHAESGPESSKAIQAEVSRPAISAEQVAEANARLTENAEAIRPKRKYTKRGTAGAAKIPEVETKVSPISADLIKTGLVIGSGFIAEARQLEAYAMDEKKAEKLSISIEKAMAFYLPQIPAEQAAWVAPVTGLLFHFGMAGFLDWQRSKERQAEAEKNANKSDETESPKPESEFVPTINSRFSENRGL